MPTEGHAADLVAGECVGHHCGAHGAIPTKSRVGAPFAWEILQATQIRKCQEMWSIFANIWILGLPVFHPPWARDSRRPAAMSLALFATERCNTDVAARLNTVGLHRIRKPTTGCPPRVKARMSRARKNHLHGVGLPDAALFGRHEHRVQLTRDLPQGEAVGPLFSHHSDRGLLDAVRHKLVTLVVKAEG